MQQGLSLSHDELHARYRVARDRLRAECNREGHWRGELASSALSTATAISALAATGRERGALPEQWRRLIEDGCRYLEAQQNDDGGWGDTDRSHSNIATSMLVRAAFHLAGAADRRREALSRVTRYIEQQGELDGLRRRYGKDKTFAVPILSNCAVAGLADWRDVQPLPFELAVFPQGMYRFLQMPVVSYAIPALVAIGQARHLLRPSPWPWMRWLRAACVRPTSRVLRRMQPQSGGYLEATPLTSFVVMNLAASGQADHPVVEAGVDFLVDSVRNDGSWPIDTDLATWNTTLTLNALDVAGEDVAAERCLDWLLSCQHLQRHPFTGAEPGGWGWTDLSGAVPDSDDTPGALLALAAWRRALSGDDRDPRIDEAARQGVEWLLKLQNRDGGWPTFCRGWGKLPFDRSGADLTAHALRAIAAWRDRWTDWGLAPPRVKLKMNRGLRYLQQQQRDDGSWIPLWFGNQDHPQEENPVYGTAKVLLVQDAGLDLPGAARARRFLRESQRPDGGWGSTCGDGPSSMEETALAVDALLPRGSSGSSGSSSSPGDRAEWDEAVQRGLRYLIRGVDEGAFTAAPIGFYFAKLWYHERLYPLIFAAQALGRAAALAGSSSPRRGSR